MTTNYLKGRSREYRIMNNLKDRGWIVVRTAGSHGPWDLIAVDPNSSRIRFIQVKPKNFSLRASNRLQDSFKWLHKNIFECSYHVISKYDELNTDNQKEDDEET